ncbi:MAG: hypothetical protein IPQ07_12820 [Myxococcales bacterium]|nr:hypothetical protein [Myxococcales bacterium]
MGQRADQRHDVAIVALAMFGATALVIGLPQRMIMFPAALATALAAIAALGAAWVICAVEEDVTPWEAGIAAAIAIPLCTGVDWFSATWVTRDPVLVAVAAVGGALGAALIARHRGSSSAVHRVVFAALVSGGVLAALALLSLGLHKLTGVHLDFVPWLAAASASALMAWRAPQLTTNTVCAGLGWHSGSAGWRCSPGLNPKLPLALIVLVLAVMGGMIVLGAGWLHGVTTRKLGARRVLATARARERGDRA